MNLQEQIAAAKRKALSALMADVIDTFIEQGFKLNEILESLADYTHLNDFEGVTFHLERAALYAEQSKSNTGTFNRSLDGSSVGSDAVD